MNTNWNSSLPHMTCFSSMPQQSNPCTPLPSGILFSPTHHIHILAFALTALNHTRDTSNNGLYFIALNASPIVCLSSSSSSFSIDSAVSVQQAMSFKHEDGNEWNDAKQKTRGSFHHSLSSSDWLSFWFSRSSHVFFSPH